MNLIGKSLILKLLMSMLIFLLLDILCASWYHIHVLKITRKKAFSGFSSIVIFFGDYSENGTIGPETKRRVEKAISLYKEHKNIKRIFCVGGSRKKKHLYGSRLMAEYMIDNGILPELISYEMISNDTLSNIEQLLILTSPTEGDVFGLVSSPYHLYRINQLYGKRFHPAGIVLLPTHNGKIMLNDFLRIWRKIHYEWLAFSLHTLCSPEFYRSIVNSIRS